MKNNYIPITFDLIINHSTDLYYGCRLVTQYGNYNIAAERYDFILPKAQYICRQFDINRNTYYNKVKPLLELPIVENEVYHSIWMPRCAFDDLESAFTARQLTTPYKKTLTRVFLYIYFFVMGSTDKFGHSIEKISEDLKIQKTQLSGALGGLTECGFISRTRYVRPNVENPGLTREYYIPNKNYGTKYYEDMQHK